MLTGYDPGVKKLWEKNNKSRGKNVTVDKSGLLVTPGIVRDLCADNRSSKFGRGSLQ
jgi:hypothetical protein